MNVVSSYVIANYARHCRPDDGGAIAQLAYAARNHEALPQHLQRVAGRQAFREFVESIGDCWGGSGDQFEATALDVLGDPAAMFSSSEIETITTWCATRRAAKFFARRITNYDTAATEAAAANAFADAHAAQFGAVCYASAPADYFFETADCSPGPDGMRLFRMVCAARSLVGTKRFTGTTKDMVCSRMIGAKSSVVAAAMVAASDHLRDELDALRSRKRFDRLIEECTMRRFFCKATLSGGRRINISTTLTDTAALKALVTNCMKKTRRAAYRGTPGGTPRGTPRGTPLTRHFYKDSSKKAFLTKGHHPAGPGGDCVPASRITEDLTGEVT
jgi:hypothetical protein